MLKPNFHDNSLPGRPPPSPCKCHPLLESLPLSQLSRPQCRPPLPACRLASQASSTQPSFKTACCFWILRCLPQLPGCTGWLHPLLFSPSSPPPGEREAAGTSPYIGGGGWARISCSLSNPAGPRNAGLEDVTLNSDPSSTPSPLGGLIPGEHPLSPQHHTVLGKTVGQGISPERDNPSACPPPSHPPAG